MALPEDALRIGENWPFLALKALLCLMSCNSGLPQLKRNVVSYMPI